MKVALLTTDAREHHRDYARPEPFFGAAPEALLQGFAELPGVEVHVVSCVRQRMQERVQLAERIWYHGLVVPRSGWMMSGYLGCIRAVRKKLRELKPDIAHGQGTERDCAITALYSGVQNVVTIHGNMAELARRFHRGSSWHWITARLEDFVLRRTAGVFCNSAYTESLVAPRARRTWRVANPLRLPFFTAPPQSCDGVPAVLNIGVVSARKRQVEILHLARRLHGSGVRVRFDFVGECAGTGEYQRTFLAEMAAAERDGFARYLGTKSVSELTALMDTSRAVLHFPSEEAFGLVVGEALARNVKFFGAKLGGIQDIAIGVDGVELFEQEDWGGLESALSRWAEGGAPRAQSAAAVMRERYHPRVIAERHVEIYREVLARSCA